MENHSTKGKQIKAEGQRAKSLPANKGIVKSVLPKEKCICRPNMNLFFWGQHYNWVWHVYGNFWIKLKLNNNKKTLQRCFLVQKVKMHLFLYNLSCAEIFNDTVNMNNAKATDTKQENKDNDWWNSFQNGDLEIQRNTHLSQPAEGGITIRTWKTGSYQWSSISLI